VKAVRNKSVLGLAIGERSLLAAEVTAGDRPVVRRVAEMEYPPGVTPLETEAFGAALAAFRRDQGFTAKSAVVGLPAKWLVVKPKEVPETDPATLADMLRLGAEAEFSSELKELIYDFVPSDDGGAGKSVLLVATQRKYVEATTAACEAAKLTAVAVTSSAMVLGEASAKASGPNGMVLAVSAGGAELIVRRNGAASVMRHLRGPDQPAAFVSAVRRVVSTLPSLGGNREMVLWDQTGMDARSLGEQLGLSVRAGDLPGLGVGVATASVNGASSRYGPAVALAASVMAEGAPPIDFLHSRMAPPSSRVLPRWAKAAIGVGAFVLLIGIYGFIELQHESGQLEAAKANLAGMQGQLDLAKAFVDKVSFAKGWHAEDPRNLMCLRDLTMALVDDEQTYVTNVALRENVKAPNGATVVGGVKLPEPGTLAGQINGKTPEQNGWSRLLDRLRHMPSFTDVKLGGTSNGEKNGEVSFSITFTYIGKTARH
jgi:hypothetical protein